jgi:hypothetical protein
VAASPSRRRDRRHHRRRRILGVGGGAAAVALGPAGNWNALPLAPRRRRPFDAIARTRRATTAIRPDIEAARGCRSGWSVTRATPGAKLRTGKAAAPDGVASMLGLPPLRANRWR